MKFLTILNEGRGALYKKSVTEIIFYFLKNKKNNPSMKVLVAQDLLNQYLYQAEKKYTKEQLRNVYDAKRLLGTNKNIEKEDKKLKDNNVKDFNEEIPIHKKSSKEIIKYFLYNKDNLTLNDYYAAELLRQYKHKNYTLINEDDLIKIKDLIIDLETSKTLRPKEIQEIIDEIKNELKPNIIKNELILIKKSNSSSMKDLYDLKLLAEDKISDIVQLEDGVNKAVVLKDGIKGVFKSFFNEIDMRDSISVGTYYKREFAAYELDRILEFNLVPPTIIKINIEMKNGEKIEDIGSIQKWIDKDKNKNGTEDSKQKIAFFDFLIGNEDRHPGNYLVDNDNNIVAIDNGLSFGEGKISSFINECYFKGFFDDNLNNKIQNIFFNLNNDKIKQIRESLFKTNLIGEKAYKSFLGRLNYIINNIEGYVRFNEIIYRMKRTNNDYKKQMEISSKSFNNLTIEESENILNESIINLKQIIIKEKE